MPSLYRDLPIKAGEFRLLRVERASELMQPLVVSLYTLPISEDNDYDAISYYWGDPNDTCTIIANGMECSVTRSLHSALRHMRQRYVGRPFWIDGLCINQKDPTERNHQVAEMGRIYSCASFVTIWLGEATPDVEDAYELISGYQTWSQVDNHRIVEHVRSDKVGAIALTRLLRRPYWQRMWVFQEIVLARNGTDICLQTWVPDYRGTHGVSTRYLAASYLGHFDATKGRDGFYLFPGDHEGEQTRLKVRGLLFDTIQNNVTFEKGKEIRQVIEALFDVEFPPLHGPLQSDEVPLDPIFRTMIFEDPTLSPQFNPDRLARLALGFAYDLLVMAASTPLPAAPSFKRLVNRFLSSFQATLQSHPGESLSEVYARLMEEDEEQLYWYREEYLARSRESSQGSTPSFFSTYGGRIGKGLETAEPGDRVAVIYSCRIPVVIRPHGEFYQLVGPCFVNAAMNGEAVENLGSIPGEEQDIILV
ncbi:hypothetical protein G7054_g4173 [Neopestalotiopsis clavispora]|nr:hypothetical protein G7054_g4173 [Neopestalotiopsis clavispora]